MSPAFSFKQTAGGSQSILPDSESESSDSGFTTAPEQPETRGYKSLPALERRRSTVHKNKASIATPTHSFLSVYGPNNIDRIANLVGSRATLSSLGEVDETKGASGAKNKHNTCMGLDHRQGRVNEGIDGDAVGSLLNPTPTAASHDENRDYSILDPTKPISGLYQHTETVDEALTRALSGSTASPESNNVAIWTDEDALDYYSANECPLKRIDTEMDNGKGDRFTKKDWKDQLADLDKQYGWDTASIKWDDDADIYEDQGYRQASSENTHLDHRLRTPLEGVVYLDHNSEKESAVVDEDDEEYYSTVEYQDEPTTPTSSNEYRYHNSFDSVSCVDSTRVHEEITNQRSGGLDFELRPGLMDYLEHRFGPDFQYQDRCFCHEWLADYREQSNKAERMYYTQYGTCLQQDACVLREYPQADMSGTEKVDKPKLTVTTPEGETLYPHDEREWPQSRNTEPDI
ncbi:hypothetical protein VMCG_07787 [Cytospora schulzeri]|uniref:Uncharacterized protein n=1 Tax=Cytospora schulzeri TaxID=448051 RepID=A0A423VZP1_9PEZI|nr:hypothetical protein VMCG_07787 [Valsa malicola]